MAEPGTLPPERSGRADVADEAKRARAVCDNGSVLDLEAVLVLGNFPAVQSLAVEQGLETLFLLVSTARS
jgi:hypothetical protein